MKNICNEYGWSQDAVPYERILTKLVVAFFKLTNDIRKVHNPVSYEAMNLRLGVPQ